MNEEKKRVVDDDAFAKSIGIELIEVREGFAVTELTIEDRHLNGVGIVQGGVVFTLADYAFAAACNEDAVPTVGINNNISYLRPAKGKRIRAEAKEISSTKRICTFTIDVTDEDGGLIAVMQATGYRKR
jgi:acyl-CoA thioesterase